MMPSCCAGVVDHADFADADAFVDAHAVVTAGTSVESDNCLLTLTSSAAATDGAVRPSLSLTALVRDFLARGAR